ncbi:sugar transporter ERD6-like 6 [Pararge aegeria]|nr:sugar transporter ERD6-like 6 [Pararge aegeria]
MGIGIVGLGMAAVVSDKVGRRWSFIVFSVPSVANYIVLYYARSAVAFMLSRFLAGTAMGAMFALKLCVPSEYAGPKTRAMFLNMISTLAPSVGSCVAHALGIVLHWRIVALIGVIPAVVGIFLPYFWVESPHWLASKGRFDECEDSFRKLHDTTANTEAELELLLKVERTKQQKAIESDTMKTSEKIKIACRKKYFWDLMLLSVFISAFLASAGKLAFSTLAVTIISGMTGPENIFIFTMVVDICVIFGAIASCILIRKISMRSMLFTTGSIGIIVLVSLSACLYFKTDSVYFKWANVGLLSLYFFIVKSGPYPILEALLGEIYPIELKVYFFFFSGTILMTAVTLSVFLLPLMVSLMGYHGMFLTNAGIMCLSLGYIWIRLPETKGRTLQEIEIYFKTKNHKIEEVLTNEQMKNLI